MLGQNFYGQLGRGQTGGKSQTPQTITDISIKHLSAGHGHNCAVLDDQSVVCWGRNFEGQLGNGTSGGNAHSDLPVAVIGTNDALSVSSDYFHSCAVLANNSIKCWGANHNGQLGNDTKTNTNIPVAVSGINNARSVSAGFSHSCALLESNNVVCWGSNTSGKLGNGTDKHANSPIKSGPVLSPQE
ncbi:RCC1 domain-containing protein [Bacterioplanoides sp.]|uniref:RCC1 domain-containing protein n=1 Tax=Bacterioplanoides sp. TaxID=2066072 RepID=UPI003B590D0D